MKILENNTISSLQVKKIERKGRWGFEKISLNKFLHVKRRLTDNQEIPFQSCFILSNLKNNKPLKFLLKSI